MRVLLDGSLYPNMTMDVPDSVVESLKKLGYILVDGVYAHPETAENVALVKAFHRKVVDLRRMSVDDFFAMVSEVDNDFNDLPFEWYRVDKEMKSIKKTQVTKTPVRVKAAMRSRNDYIFVYDKCDEEIILLTLV